MIDDESGVTLQTNPHQTSKLAYLLGMYSEKAHSYPVNTRKLLQYSYWSQYAWDANLWPQLNELLAHHIVYLHQAEVAETSYSLARAGQGTPAIWKQLKDEIEDNLQSQIFLRHSQK